MRRPKIAAIGFAAFALVAALAAAVHWPSSAMADPRTQGTHAASQAPIQPAAVSTPLHRVVI